MLASTFFIIRIGEFAGDGCQSEASFEPAEIKRRYLIQAKILSSIAFGEVMAHFHPGNVNRRYIVSIGSICWSCLMTIPGGKTG